MSLLIKTYKGTVTGYSEQVMLFAASRGKAMVKLWHMVSVAEDISFKRLLERAKVRRCPSPCGFGELITVLGEKAYWIEHTGGNQIRFARPNSETVLISHKSDVEPKQGHRLKIGEAE